MERCVSLTVSALEGLKKEDVLNKTKKGPQLQEIIDHLLKLKSGHIAELSVEVSDELETCLASTSECLLPNQIHVEDHRRSTSLYPHKDLWFYMVHHLVSSHHKDDKRYD